MIGTGSCVVKTLTRHHLYCEPPAEQPPPLREAPDALPEFMVSEQAPGWARHWACAEALLTGGFPMQVQMGNLRFSLGHVQYDGETPVAFPMAAQVGLGVGISLLALGVIIIVLMYRWVLPDVAGLGRGRLPRSQQTSYRGSGSEYFRLWARQSQPQLLN